MFKRFAVFFFLLISLSACQSTLNLSSKKINSVNLTGKRLLIVTYDTEVSKPFVISTKNYLALTLQNQGLSVEKINISQTDSLVSKSMKRIYLQRTKTATVKHIETQAAKTEFQKAALTFQPDIILYLKVVQTTSILRGHLTGQIEEFRGAVLDINLKTSAAQATPLWQGQINGQKITATDQPTIARKAADRIAQELKKDKFIQ